MAFGSGTLAKSLTSVFSIGMGAFALSQFRTARPSVFAKDLKYKSAKPLNGSTIAMSLSVTHSAYSEF